MANIIQNRYLRAELTVLPSMESLENTPLDRKLLALHSQEAIAKILQAY